jgi:hypothetical protein
MNEFSVPVWFKVEAKSKSEALSIVESLVNPTRLDCRAEYSIESDDIIEYNEDGDDTGETNCRDSNCPMCEGTGISKL